MTTVFEKNVACAVCGEEQTVQVMGSTNALGSMDLDTRPPQMRRSSMWLWLQECSSCGYVASDLGDASEVGQIESLWHAYLAELNNPKRQRLANLFVCRSLLDEAAADLASAGWRRLHAAWVCDDRGPAEEASAQRRAAITLFERSRTAGKPVMEAAIGGDELLLADLSRRCGDFEGALAFCELGMKLPVDAFLRGLLTFEKQLCAAGDAACHNVGEADGRVS
jgi:hypothetical protein